VAPAVPPVAPALAAGLEERLREITGKNIQAALHDQPPVTARNLPSAPHSLFQALAPHQPGEAAAPDGYLDACGRERRLVTRTRERYAEIHGRLEAGESLSAISRATGLDRKTVQRFARAGSAGELLSKATSRESKLDQFTPYLHQRWNQGVTDAAALHAELRERGWTGSEQTVRRYVRPFRQALTAPDPAPAVPKTRQITRWLLTHPDRLQPGEQAQLQAIRARCPHISRYSPSPRAYASIVPGARPRSVQICSHVAACSCRPITGHFSLSTTVPLKPSPKSVVAPREHHHPGRFHVTFKMIKRQMYGRAGFDLLRKRVISHPALPDHKIRGRAELRERQPLRTGELRERRQLEITAALVR
jgi:hypothetical protein